MKRIKVIKLDDKIQYEKVIYQYSEEDVKLLIDAVKGMLAERDDPRNKDRFLAPVIHYMSDDCETTVWGRARELVKEFEDGTKRT
jgi:hypothetical protein